MSRRFQMKKGQMDNLNLRMRVGFQLKDVDELPKQRGKRAVTVKYTSGEGIYEKRGKPEYSIHQTLSMTSLATSSSIPDNQKVDTIFRTISESALQNSLTPKQRVIKMNRAMRLKMLVQKLKRYRRFPIFTHALKKTGRHQVIFALTKIEEEINLNMHTFQSFKRVVLSLLVPLEGIPEVGELASEIESYTSQLISEEVQIEFDVGSMNVQKEVDKITKILMDARSLGQWYYKNKKVVKERMVMPEELIYICDLVRSLPKPYLIGVWEIIHEKPFREIGRFKCQEIDVTTLKAKKVREIEYYVKLVLTRIKKSKGSKKNKLQVRLKGLQEKLGQMVVGCEQNQMVVEGEEIGNEKQNDEKREEEMQRKRVKQGQRRELQKSIKQIQSLLEISSSDSEMITDDQDD